MQSSPLRIGHMLSALAALALALPAAASASTIAYKPCSGTNNFACAELAVPLDPGGSTPGSLMLAVRRHRAAVGEARTAVIALAGGPGQAAIPFAEQFAELLGPIAATRDLIVFDQRGTGQSGALECKAFAHLSSATPPPAAMRGCAAQLGSQRAFYGSGASVADIEAIRQAGGYEKLVLYGTSYGTKVAEDYAKAYPSHVEALVLDSVVGPAAPEAFNRSTFAAIPRVMREICRHGDCRGVTADPARDLARLLSRIHAGHLRGRVIGPHGRPHSIRITAQAMLGALLAGDFSGALRATTVSAVRSAVLGDYAPLARLLATLPGEEAEAESEGIDIPLYYATSCVDQAFPWSASAPPAARLAAARAAARALGSRAFAPFDAADAIELSDIPACAYWPPGPSPAVAAGPLPAVPTLILSGAYDMRTPTSNAREVARAIPGSKLLVVPRVGHSVLGGEGAVCAQGALQALFASRPVEPCREGPAPPRLRPPAPAPLSVARISPEHGYRGLPGRTAHAVQLTLADLGRELALTIETSGNLESLLSRPELRVGGLRSGWAVLKNGGVSFRDYSFVPGMTVSGTLRLESADLRIAGPDVAAGTLRLGSHRSLVGTLGGSHVRVAASGERAAAIVGVDAATRHANDPGGAPARAAAGVLAGDIERILDA